ncbi:MAG TPA: transposase [Acidobacteriaceae bacterium]
MSIPTRVNNFGTFFLTAACAERRRIFQVDNNAKLLVETILHYRTHYLLHAYVVMPDHFHLILTPQDIAIERAMQYIKGGFSRRYNAARKLKMEVWQRGYTDHRIRDAKDYAARKHYVEQNPVVRGLVEIANQHEYSSANGIVAMDDYLRG